MFIKDKAIAINGRHTLLSNNIRHSYVTPADIDLVKSNSDSNYLPHNYNELTFYDPICIVIFTSDLINGSWYRIISQSIPLPSPSISTKRSWSCYCKLAESATMVFFFFLNTIETICYKLLPNHTGDQPKHIVAVVLIDQERSASMCPHWFARSATPPPPFTHRPIYLHRFFNGLWDDDRSVFSRCVHN